MFIGVICAEGDLHKSARTFSIEWLRALGMIKPHGSELLEMRMRESINELIQGLSSQITSEDQTLDIDIFSDLHHSLGNVMNQLVFGLKYSKDDETWLYLQHLQEEGVKHIGISGAVNFLPILRFLPQNRKTLAFLVDGKRKTHEIYAKIVENCQNSLDSYPECILKSFLLRKKEETQASKFFSDTQLYHLLADLFGAGVDTVSFNLHYDNECEKATL